MSMRYRYHLFGSYARFTQGGLMMIHQLSRYSTEVRASTCGHYATAMPLATTNDSYIRMKYLTIEIADAPRDDTAS